MSVTGNPNKTADRLDAAGITISLVCAAQCLILPITAVIAPLLLPGMSDIFGHTEAWHLPLLLLATPVALIGLRWGVKRTGGGLRLWYLGILGLGFMIAGATHIFGELAEIGLTLIGVSILLYAHLANWRARRRSCHEHGGDTAPAE